MAERPNLPDIPGLLLQITGLLTESAISGIRNFLYDSLTWLGQQAETISDYPAIQNTDVARQLRRTGDSLKEAGNVSFEAIYTSIHRAAESLMETLQKLHILDKSTFQALGTNIAAESILGDSFLGSADPSLAKTSFRRNGSDADAASIVEDFRASGLDRILVCVPGLFQDESLWHAGRPHSLETLFRDTGYFPVFLRMHPGHHIPEMGVELAGLLEDLTKVLGRSISILSFSHGGLFLRSALIQGRRNSQGFGALIDRAILISSPDGGYFIEKTGFLFGFGFGDIPSRALKFMSLAGNKYTPAFRDMASAAIREEDLHKPGPFLPNSPDRYYGEFEGISSYQIYSLIADSNHIWSNWLGDGLIEEPSLAMLSERAFRAQSDPDERVHCLIGPSHFQILQSEALSETLKRILLRTA